MGEFLSLTFHCLLFVLWLNYALHFHNLTPCKFYLYTRIVLVASAFLWHSGELKQTLTLKAVKGKSSTLK